MQRLLATMLLCLGVCEATAKDPDPAGPKVDGRWTIVYAEEGGRRNTAWEARPATLDKGKLTYEEDGKERSVQLKFGPHQTLTAVGLGKAGDATHKGVFIAAQDYLSISLVTDGKKDTGSSGDFILILRRQRAK